MHETSRLKASPKTSSITDPLILRVIAHPIRMRLYELLVSGGPATAARLSAHVKAAPGSLSYHLRQLAEHGYVEEASELGRDGRERWWRAIPGGMRWSPADFQGSPAKREALATAQQALVARQLERLHTWQSSGVKRWGTGWADAAVSVDMMLYLDESELRQLANELSELIKRWAERSRASRSQPAHSAGNGDRREQVFMFVHAFPYADEPHPPTRATA